MKSLTMMITSTVTFITMMMWLMYAQVSVSFWENFVYVLNAWLLITTKNNDPKFLQISFPDEV